MNTINVEAGCPEYLCAPDMGALLGPGYSVVNAVLVFAGSPTRPRRPKRRLGQALRGGIHHSEDKQVIT